MVDAVADAPSITGGTSTTGNEDTPPSRSARTSSYALDRCRRLRTRQRCGVVGLPDRRSARLDHQRRSNRQNTVAGVTTIIAASAADIRATLNSFRVTPPLHSDTDFSISVAVTPPTPEA